MIFRLPPKKKTTKKSNLTNISKFKSDKLKNLIIFQEKKINYS